MARSPAEIVNIYNLVMWNEMRPELVREICADPIIRHYSGKRVELSHQDQIDRVEEFRDHGMVFERVVQFDEGEFVAWVWNCTSTNDEHQSKDAEDDELHNSRFMLSYNRKASMPTNAHPWEL